MAKQKIHELAKELKLTNKVVVDYLNRKVKDKEKKYTSSNFLEAEEAADIRANLDSLVKADHELKAKQADTRQKSGEQKGSASKEGEARPKKKASITAVFNAQYSKQNRKQSGNRNKQSGERADRERGQRTVRPAERPPPPWEDFPRPAGRAPGGPRRRRCP